jgi:hypothetical protein
MDPGVQALIVLRIDIGTLADQATEGRLDVRTRTTEPVVKVEVPEGGVHIVPPKQSDDIAAEPDAFGVPGRPADLAGCFGKLIDPSLGIRVRRLALSRLVAGFIGAFGVAALSHGRNCREQTRRREHCSETRTQKGGHGVVFLV